ncbi:MAG TPA: DUF998 domain-containing protein [Polyangia bacterium]
MTAERRPRETPAELSLRSHRCVIGILGATLPFAVYLLAGLRQTTGLDRWQFLPSVSAYYHTGAGPLFVGVLFAISLFLYTYRGYVEDVADRIVGKTGGVAAFLVATFPTRAPQPVEAPSWWNERTGVIHYSAAAVLFGCFIVFSVWLFRKSEFRDRRARPFMKKVRDGICLGCGLVMIGAMAWAGLSSLRGGPIFYPEALAILAFGVSWLTKAEALPILRDR